MFTDLTPCRWGHTLLYAPKAMAFSDQLECVTEEKEASLLEFVTYTSLIHTLNLATCSWGADAAYLDLLFLRYYIIISSDLLKTFQILFSVPNYN